MNQPNVSSSSFTGFAQSILGPQGGPRPRAGKKSDQAQPPIHPTKAAGNGEMVLLSLEGKNQCSINGLVDRGTSVVCDCDGRLVVCTVA